MPRAGTLVICVQNLDYSGANQVILNVIKGKLHLCNCVVLSTRMGTFAARFVETGAAVRIGDLPSLLDEIKDVFCVVCNTLMCADIVVDMAKRPHPVVWILHEWWDDEMIKENLRIRNISTMTVDTIKQALRDAACVVFVCEAQRRLYNPPYDNTVVIYVGVPQPLNFSLSDFDSRDRSCYLPCETKEEVKSVFTMLSLGIVCPRKNQVWAVELFRKAFPEDCDDVRLLIVGARYTRDYEALYVEEVKQAIQGDPRIELLPVTDNVDQYYEIADVLLMTSINEVTPMVISEAMSWGIPVLSTNIAGIPEMFHDNVEGFLFSPGDDSTATRRMNEMYENKNDLRARMGKAGKERFAAVFDLEIMVEKYRELLLQVAPPLILVDMDGVLVDWDQGFEEHWQGRSVIDREKSYYMQQCVPAEYYHEAELLMLQEGFFEGLPPMHGAIQAMTEMEESGFKVMICTAPIMTSRFCAQEKINWVRKWLGERWLDKMILTQDKTTVRGDLLIDDKPFDGLSPYGKHTTATWKQIVYHQSYNWNMRVPRLLCWCDWKHVVIPLFGKAPAFNPYAFEYGETLLKPKSKLSPRSQRKSLRLQGDLRATAQYQQECILGQTKEGEEPLSPEEVASIAGTGSLFHDSIDLEEDSDRGSPRITRSSTPVPPPPPPSTPISTPLPTPTTSPVHKHAQYIKAPMGNSIPLLHSARANVGTKANSTPVSPSSPTQHAPYAHVAHGPLHIQKLPSSKVSSVTGRQVPKINITRERESSRFGGEDDYRDNFQSFRKVYRSWREDSGSVSSPTRETHSPTNRNSPIRPEEQQYGQGGGEGEQKHSS